jgi:hypothetical protein
VNDIVDKPSTCQEAYHILIKLVLLL